MTISMWRQHGLGRLLLAILMLAGALGPQALTGQGDQPATQTEKLPNKPDDLKFAVIGDNGTGDRPEFDVAQQMATLHQRFPFNLVIMLGDNFYGSQNPADLVSKFEKPYAPLLAAGVIFRASLGNHDAPTNRSYKPLNMNDQRYYSYVAKNVRFLVLDTNAMDAQQVAWVETTLKGAQEPWKICYFHHPLYSDGGRHGSSVNMRVLLEPLFVKYGVDVVFSGHDHIYERLKPQKGIHYFVAGSSGQLRQGDLERSQMTAVGFDEDQVFMGVEVSGDDLFFEAISRTGKTVDSGVIHRRNAPVMTTAGH